MNQQHAKKIDWRCWLFLIIGILIGFAIGWALYRVPVPEGDCVRPDGSIAASSVSRNACTSICPECTWRQGGGPE